MDNAPYHSVMTEQIQNNAWRKADIVTWLNLCFEESCIITECLEIVKQNKFVVNGIAKKSGHTVLRLPSYHCTLNPIELISDSN